MVLLRGGRGRVQVSTAKFWWGASMALPCLLLFTAGVLVKQMHHVK